LSDVEITVEEVEATATLFQDLALLYEALLAMMEES